jgi:hypothetical protein
MSMRFPSHHPGPARPAPITIETHGRGRWFPGGLRTAPRVPCRRRYPRHYRMRREDSRFATLSAQIPGDSYESRPHMRFGERPGEVSGRNGSVMRGSFAPQKGQ